MNPMEKKYWKTKMYHVVLLLVLIGSLNWGTTASRSMDLSTVC